MSGTSDTAMSRRKSLKKSLRESFRRLRKGRSQRRRSEPPKEKTYVSCLLYSRQQEQAAECDPSEKCFRMFSDNAVANLWCQIITYSCFLTCKKGLIMTKWLIDNVQIYSDNTELFATWSVDVTISSTGLRVLTLHCEQEHPESDHCGAARKAGIALSFCSAKRSMLYESYPLLLLHIPSMWNFRNSSSNIMILLTS